MKTNRFTFLSVAMIGSAALSLSACGSDSSSGDSKPIKLDDTGSSGGGDTSLGDASSSGGGADGSSSSGADASSSGAADASSSGGADAGTNDVGIKIDCPGGAGCACDPKKIGECKYGLCNPTPDGYTCAAPCTDECTNDFECRTIEISGGDSANLCVHKYPTICVPCKSNAVCSSAFDPTAACIRRGQDGYYCGSTCKSNSDCPTGYACDETTDIEGNKVNQCVTDDGSICTCSKFAMAAKMSTLCSDADGCAGTRTCLVDGEAGAPTGGGLSQCTGGSMAAETCDGIDNNCDGKTDEAVCDDDNDCTTDSCDSKTGKCTNAPLNKGACDDGDKCTESDACKAGTCTGTPKKCDDGVACTKGLCKEGSCTTEPDTGASCDDGDKCTENDKCNDQAKCAGTAMDCDDGNKCSIDTCKEGVCSSGVVQAGPCQDGDACTAGDKCVKDGAGKLICKAGAAIDCDDQNDCTVDSCDKAKGCVHKVDTGFEKSCYPGDDKYKGVGECKAGKQKCQQDGSLGPCDGALMPAGKETCGNKKDDDCDGVTDGGCGAAGVAGRFGNVTVSGKSGTRSIRIFVGGGSVGGPAKAAGKNSVELGFYAWVASLLK